MYFLTGLQWWSALALGLAFAGVVAVVARFIMHRLQRNSGDDPVRHAGPLMPTLGALFAFLSAFVIATEWGAQSQSQAIVQHVASASSRLAWAATAPGAETAFIQESIAAELRTTADRGWAALGDGRTGDAIASEEFRVLESAVRNGAYSQAVAAPAANELLASTDDMASARRELAANSERTLPILLFLALGVSGIALITNAVTLTIRSHARSTVVVASVILLVGVDLAVVLALASPFRGSFVVSSRPLTIVAQQIEDGWFTVQ